MLLLSGQQPERDCRMGNPSQSRLPEIGRGRRFSPQDDHYLSVVQKVPADNPIKPNAEMVQNGVTAKTSNAETH